MKTYIVFVKFQWAGVAVARYIDSQWARKEAATERRNNLIECFKTFNCFSSTSGGATAECFEALVTDAKILRRKIKTHDRPNR